MDYTQIDRLEGLMKERHPGWEYTRRECNGGQQICFFGYKGRIVASAVIHEFSYGNEDGLLEFWAGGSSDAIGSLSAEQALKEFEKALK